MLLRCTASIVCNQIEFVREKEMESSPVIKSLIHFVCLLIFLASSVSSISINGHLISCLASDREALMDFKTGLQDHANVLSSWNERNNCCEWQGIKCDNNTGAVVEVDLHNSYNSDPNNSNYSSSYGRYEFWNLSGEIRPSLMNLKSLTYLDLSFNTFNGLHIPEFFGSLKNLQYLNLSHAGFIGKIPPYLGNLSHLQVLDLGFLEIYVDNFQWMNGLVSLEYLAMDGVDLSLVKDWVGELNNELPSIVELHLSSCNLSSCVPPLVHLNFSSLAVIDLSFNSFHSKMPDWLLNISSLQHIYMSESGLFGKIPLGLGEMPNLLWLDLSRNYDLTASCSQLFGKRWEKIQAINLRENQVQGKLLSFLGNMTSLTRLYLDSNSIEGGIPSSIGRLCNLSRLSLSRNNMTGNLPEILEGTQSCPSKKPLPNLQYLALTKNQLVGKIPNWLGQLENLVGLDLGNNLFEGPIPSSLGSLQNLNILQLGRNKLNGTLPKSLGKLSALSGFDVTSNQLGGIISEIHFSKLINLTFLDLSSNSFVVNISSNWVPPFQVKLLIMSSCILGPSFPSWLQSQKEMEYLDLSNASISDSIPDWFWKGMTNLALLSLAQNKISGQIPKSIGEMCNSLLSIDLSSNNFIGRIPSSLANCSSLNALSLSNNSLSGPIPYSLGQLQNLTKLHLSDNQLSGKLPSSFINLSYLQTLDLGNNELSGEIPSWIGDGLSNLSILNLRSNAFFGEIPHELSKLSSLQVLDLGENDLSGSIPTSFGDLKAMIHQEERRNKNLRYMIYQDVHNKLVAHRVDNYQDRLVVNTKGQSLMYTKTLSLVTSIDLSGNKLTGIFPQEMTKLSNLMYLNMSRNHISGSIPESISNMNQLQSLDLSSNQLTGSIPQNLSSLAFLGYLNLSYNNLSGAIPYTGHTTTFEASSYAGNPGLFGCPLPVRCQSNNDVPGNGSSDNGTSNDGTNDGDDDGLLNEWFYLSLGVGFAAGILVPFLILSMKRSWSDAYFDLLEVIIIRFLVFLQRRKISHGSKIKPHYSS